MAEVWFFMLAGMLTAYAALDGYDLGVGAIYLAVSKTNEERHACLAAIGPLWNGNEVWLIAAGGSLFFSFPRVYAVSFSGFYLALMLVLWLLILRGISLEFRNQIDNHLWEAFWDTGFTVGSALLTLLLGVALGNLVRGLPLDENGIFQGSFELMLNPSSVLVGLLSVAILCLHGANFLCVKTTGPVHDRSRTLSRRFVWGVAVLILLVTVVSGMQRPELMHSALWPLTIVLALVMVVSLVATVVFVRQDRDREAFGAGLALVVSLLGCAAASIFPDLLHSNLNPHYSLTVQNAASSPNTLYNGFLLIGTAIVLVIVCQVYVHRAFRGKVRTDDFHHGAY